MLIFEDNQHDLEVAVEGLSDFLDRRIHTEPPVDIEMKVTLSIFMFTNTLNER